MQLSHFILFLYAILHFVKPALTTEPPVSRVQRFLCCLRWQLVGFRSRILVVT